MLSFDGKGIAMRHARREALIRDRLTEIKAVSSAWKTRQEELSRTVRERRLGSRPAVLTAPIHIGVGTK